jgi:hypothetical protein
MNRLFSACIGLALGLAATEQCQGIVTNHRLHRLGEQDVPPAGALLPGDNPTVDGGTDLVDASKVGLTFYYGQPGFGGPPVPLGLVPGSTFSMEFTNVDSRYVAPAALVGVSENFGLEVYIQVSAGITEGRAFSNGDVGVPFGTLTRGYGLGVHGGQYSAFLPGSGCVDSICPTPVAALPGVPVEMALVNVDGTQFDVYIQRTLVLSVSVPAVIPPVATDVLAMGNFVGNQAPPNFAGVLDEARVFDFAPGQFDPHTDLGAAAAGVGFGAVPGQANCHGKSVSTLANQFGGLRGAASALGFPSVPALHDAIRAFCQG